MVEYEGCRTSLHYPVVVVSHSHEGGVYLHHCALVRVAEQKAAGGFDQWNTPTLLTVRDCRYHFLWCIKVAIKVVNGHVPDS